MANRKPSLVRINKTGQRNGRVPVARRQLEELHWHLGDPVVVEVVGNHLEIRRVSVTVQDDGKEVQRGREIAEGGESRVAR